MQDRIIRIYGKYLLPDKVLLQAVLLFLCHNQM
jgi:hypothetical protein